MIGRMLEELGLFVGVHKDTNNESRFFQRINEWLFRQCGGRWDFPQPIFFLLKNEVLMAQAEVYIKRLLRSIRSTLFLGIRGYLLRRDILALDIPWGWKDPRNTFTLQIWLRIFPDAKIIHIERHGVDVAESLRVRSKKVFYTATQNYEKRYRYIVPFLQKPGGFTESPRCIRLEGGFSLWEEYLAQADDVLSSLPDNRVLKLREPLPILRRCVDFCGLNATDSQIQNLVRTINPNRAFAFQQDKELYAFAEEYRHRLERWGY